MFKQSFIQAALIGATVLTLGISHANAGAIHDAGQLPRQR